jgi:hypothetical protein
MLAAQGRMGFQGRGRAAVVAALVSVALTACSPSIGELNLRPELHYQQTVKIKGEITRMQSAGDDTVLEIADAREDRILVRVKGKPSASIGDWVKVEGILVPEARVGDRTLYDVVVAEDVSDSSAPWFPNLL